MRLKTQGVYDGFRAYSGRTWRKGHGGFKYSDYWYWRGFSNRWAVMVINDLVGIEIIASFYNMHMLDK